MKSYSDHMMRVPLQGCPKSECRLTCIRMQRVHWSNCALCPLLAVSCGDAGLALFMLSPLHEWTIDDFPWTKPCGRLTCITSLLIHVSDSTQKNRLVCMPSLRNYWVLGLCPSSSILETRRHDVSETGSVFILRWGVGGRHLLSWVP
jgi:hypothetical protein